MITPKEGAKYMLEQLAEVTARLPKKVYTQPLAVFSNVSIGQHFRHIYNFYEILFRQCSSGKIDYAERQRGTDLEVDPQLISTLFRRLLKQLSYLDEQQDVQILSDFSKQVSAGRQLVASTVGRELAYVFDHAVHHLAIVKIGVKAVFPEIVLPQDLGVAPSTLRAHT